MDLLEAIQSTFTVADDRLWQNPWTYSPREELRDRLNDRLQGKEPSMVWNTAHWRNQA